MACCRRGGVVVALVAAAAHHQGPHVPVHEDQRRLRYCRCHCGNPASPSTNTHTYSRACALCACRTTLHTVQRRVPVAVSVCCISVPIAVHTCRHDGNACSCYVAALSPHFCRVLPHCWRSNRWLKPCVVEHSVSRVVGLDGFPTPCVAHYLAHASDAGSLVAQPRILHGTALTVAAIWSRLADGDAAVHPLPE